MQKYNLSTFYSYGILRALAFFFALLLLLTTVFSYTRVLPGYEHTSQVSAATSSTLNYQGRLLSSAGTIVPDGNYHLEFKLYDGGTQGGPAGTGESNAGTLLWTETRTTGDLVRVVNGYFSVNLGSVSAFPALNWDDELYLTINVGGNTGSPSWDGEMLAPGNKRTKVTGVPYAFAAGQLARTNAGNRANLELEAPTGGDQTFLIPDQATPGTYNICIQNSGNCGFAADDGSSGGYIQNGTALQSNANFNIQSANTGSIGGIIRGAVGQTADLLQLQDSSGVILTAFQADGKLVFGPSGSQDTNLYRSAANTLKTDDNFLIQTVANSSAAFQIQNNAAQTLLVADTVSQRLAVGPAARRPWHRDCCRLDDDGRGIGGQPDRRRPAFRAHSYWAGPRCRQRPTGTSVYSTTTQVAAKAATCTEGSPSAQSGPATVT